MKTQQRSQRSAITFLTATIVPMMLAGCGEEGGAAAGIDPYATQDSALYFAGGAASWTTRDNLVPVCWDMTPLSPIATFGDVTSPQFETLRTLVQRAVVNSWDAATAVRFNRVWGPCPTTGNTSFVRVVIAQVAGTTSGGAADMGVGALRTPQLTTCGYAADSNAICYDNSVAMGFGASASRAENDFVVRHEFGHILGFDHEQNSPINDGTCQPDDNANPNGIILTSFDPNSIMNYCGPRPTGLSALDIAGARRAYGFPTADFDDNGTADILWHNGSTGQTQIWQMNQANRTGALTLSAGLNVTDSTGWTPIATADFNLDGRPDIFWHNGLTGENQFWYMDAWSRIGFENLVFNQSLVNSSGWRPVAAADFDSDGMPDLLWHNGTTGESQIWHLSAPLGSLTGAPPSPIALRDAVMLDAGLNVADSTGWRIVGVGDFNQNGNADILWHNGNTGESQVWSMKDTVLGYPKSFAADLNTSDATGWTPVEVDDFNGDRRPDVLWHQGSTGALQIWYMSDTARIGFKNLSSGLNVPASSGWSVVRR